MTNASPNRFCSPNPPAVCSSHRSQTSSKTTLHYKVRRNCKPGNQQPQVLCTTHHTRDRQTLPRCNLHPPLHRTRSVAARTPRQSSPNNRFAVAHTAPPNPLAIPACPSTHHLGQTTTTRRKGTQRKQPRHGRTAPASSAATGHNPNPAPPRCMQAHPATDRHRLRPPAPPIVPGSAPLPPSARLRMLS